MGSFFSSALHDCFWYTFSFHYCFCWSYYYYLKDVISILFYSSISLLDLFEFLLVLAELLVVLLFNSAVLSLVLIFIVIVALMFLCSVPQIFFPSCAHFCVLLHFRFSLSLTNFCGCVSFLLCFLYSLYVFLNVCTYIILFHSEFTYWRTQGCLPSVLRRKLVVVYGKCHLRRSRPAQACATLAQVQNEAKERSSMSHDGGVRKRYRWSQITESQVPTRNSVKYMLAQCEVQVNFVLYCVW